MRISDSITFQLTEEENLFSDKINHLQPGLSNNLLLSTQDGLGILHFNDQAQVRVEHYNEMDGVNSNNVFNSVEDNSGRIWLGTFDSGLNVIDGSEIYSIKKEQGLATNGLASLIYDPLTGAIWAGTTDGISCIGIAEEDGLNIESIINYNQQSGLKGLGHLST